MFLPLCERFLGMCVFVCAQEGFSVCVCCSEMSRFNSSTVWGPTGLRKACCSVGLTSHKPDISLCSACARVHARGSCCRGGQRPIYKKKEETNDFCKWNENNIALLKERSIINLDSGYLPGVEKFN